MLQYEKIDVPEGIYVNKTSASKECDLCHYWFFRDAGFKFEINVCIKCHDSLTMVYSLKNITILSAKAVTFRCLLMGISKNEVLKKLHNSVLQDKGALLMEAKATQIKIINQARHSYYDTIRLKNLDLEINRKQALIKRIDDY